MSISKLGKRRQVVIPKSICDAAGLHEGDFVEVTRRNGRILITPSAMPDPDDTLTPEEEEMVRRGEEQLRRGEYVTLEELEHDLERSARKRGRKSA
jgi:AbrB family looped-hinge helix DNA binding protein